MSIVLVAWYLGRVHVILFAAALYSAHTVCNKNLTALGVHPCPFHGPPERQKLGTRKLPDEESALWLQELRQESPLLRINRRNRLGLKCSPLVRSAAKSSWILREPGSVRRGQTPGPPTKHWSLRAEMRSALCDDAPTATEMTIALERRSATIQDRRRASG